MSWTLGHAHAWSIGAVPLKPGAACGDGTTDPGEDCDLGAANGQHDRMVLVATEPLTRNEPWEPFAAGELRVFVDGEQVWQAASKRPGVRVESARGAPAFASVLAA